MQYQLNTEHGLLLHGPGGGRGGGGGGGMIPLPRTVLAVSVRLAVLGDDSSITNVQSEYKNRKGKI